jgi:hypothetical protein
VKNLTLLLSLLSANFSSCLCFAKLFDLYYSVYPGPSETVRGSNFYWGVLFLLLLYFTLYPFVTKRGSNFYFLDVECISKSVKWFLSHNGQRGSLLGFDWPHSVFGQNRLYVKMLYQGFHYSEWCQKILHCLQVRIFQFPVSRLDDVSSRLDPHLQTVPFVRTTCHTVRTPRQIKHYLSRRRAFPSGPSLFREATVPACIRPDVSTAHPDAFQWSISFRFFPSSI